MKYFKRLYYKFKLMKYEKLLDKVLYIRGSGKTSGTSYLYAKYLYYLRLLKEESK